MLDRIYERVEKRLHNDADFKVTIIKEYICTVVDRLCIRLNTEELPESFCSIAVDAVVKMHRRAFYEGISSENDGGASVSFVNDILNEYETEIAQYNLSNKKKVRFY